MASCQEQKAASIQVKASDWISCLLRSSSSTHKHSGIKSTHTLLKLILSSRHIQTHRNTDRHACTNTQTHAQTHTHSDTHIDTHTRTVINPRLSPVHRECDFHSSCVFPYTPPPCSIGSTTVNKQKAHWPSLSWEQPMGGRRYEMTATQSRSPAGKTEENSQDVFKPWSGGGRGILFLGELNAFHHPASV